MQSHFRENIECLREEISKKEKALNEKKEKLFLKGGDMTQWDLDTSSLLTDQIPTVVKDKARVLPLMLTKETQHVSDLKDLFLVVSQAFKRDAARVSEVGLAEMAEHLQTVAAEPLIEGHHQ